MELIRISENKIKIMLNASDMNAYDLPTDGIDYCENNVRDAFRAVLKDAGRKAGMDFSDGRLSIQLYPSKSGGCEMFVTRTAARSKSEHGRVSEKESSTQCGNANEALHWERAEAFSFESLRWLLSICKRLKHIGFSGSSAAFRDDIGRYYLILDSPGQFRPQILECGNSEQAEAVRLYIGEHGNTICSRNAVELLGVL